MGYSEPSGHGFFATLWLGPPPARAGAGVACAAPPRPLALAVATQEATDKDSTWLRKKLSREIAVAIRKPLAGQRLARNPFPPPRVSCEGCAVFAE